jgi:hypothetical protein
VSLRSALPLQSESEGRTFEGVVILINCARDSINARIDVMDCWNSMTRAAGNLFEI